MIGVVLVDFKKAFHRVDHQILLNKLEIYGIKDDALSWFDIYPTNRKQQVSINNCKSDFKQISYGVPQESILGPLLFLLFINDLPLYTNNVFTDLFADDTTLYDLQDSMEQIENNLQSALKVYRSGVEVMVWFWTHLKPRLCCNNKPEATKTQ